MGGCFPTRWNRQTEKRWLLLIAIFPLGVPKLMQQRGVSAASLVWERRSGYPTGEHVKYNYACSMIRIDESP